eukprot:jgi/Picsp_1/4413/NSC_06635-R1_protein
MWWKKIPKRLKALLHGKRLAIFLLLLIFYSVAIKDCTIITTNSPLSCETQWEERLRSYQHYVGLLQEKEEARKHTISAWDGKTAYDLYEPELVCDLERRVGPADINIGDGPKFVCGPHFLQHEDECLVYSIGSDWNFQFEDGIRKHAPYCEFHIFDGTMNLSARALPNGLEEKRFHFHNWNVDVTSCVSGKGWTSKSIVQSLSELDHLRKTIHIFKIDCEGCEHGVMPHVLELVKTGQLKVDQIQIEMHGTNAQKIQDLFQSFRSAGFAIFHKERNHWGCNGYGCVEYALISMTKAREIFRKGHCLPMQPTRTKDPRYSMSPWWHLPYKRSLQQGSIQKKQFPYNISARNDVGLLQLLCYSGALRPSSTLIDIGLPYESIYFAKMGHFAEAFEARKEGYESVKATIEKNGLKDAINLHHTALSNFTGKIRIYEAQDSSSILESAVDVGPELKKRTEEGMRESMVTVSPLDAYLDLADAMKIDTQGVEPEIFMGARKVFQSGRPFPIIMEYCGRLRKFEELEIGIHILRGLGYQCYGKNQFNLTESNNFCGDFYCAKEIQEHRCSI